MSNTWFQFKQFTIEQDQCAMKVSTDACIQGAWAGRFLSSRPDCGTVLDIGTGTGLLSLMIAQKAPWATVTALEQEQQAARQAAENMERSPWHSSCRVVPLALQDWIASRHPSTLFDFIICNPPFFHNQLPARKAERNMARHDALSPALLTRSVRALLSPSGHCCILYPAREWSSWETHARQNGLFLSQVLHVRPGAHRPVNRITGIYAPQAPGSIAEEELIIYETPGMYSSGFRKLLEDYYLGL